MKQQDKDAIQVGYMGRITYRNKDTGEITYEFLSRTTRSSGRTPYVNPKVIPSKLRQDIDWIHGGGYQGPLEVIKAEVVKVEQRVVGVEGEELI